MYLGKKVKGFTLIEIIVAMALAGLIFSIVVVIYQTLFSAQEHIENREFSDVYMLFDDIDRNSVIAKDILVLSPSDFQIDRIDGCSVEYKLSGNRVEKILSGTCSNEKKLIVGNIQSFNVVSDVVPDTYRITIKKTNENYTRSFIVRKP